MRRAAPLVALLAAAPVALAADPPANPVVAVRGSDTLTEAGVRALIASQPEDQRRKLQSDPQALQRLITDAFLQRTILAEAASRKWDSRPEVAAMLARVRQAAILQSFVAAQSQPPAAYPAEADVKAAYDRAGPQLTRPRAYHLAQVFVAVASNAPPAALPAARRELDDFAHELAAGRASFEVPAGRAPGATYADLGWVTEPQLQKAAHDAVAGLPEGQISPPVCAPGGCTLIKLRATRPAGPPPLSEVHDQIAHLLREQKQKQLAQAYMNGLLAKTPVRVDTTRLAHVLGP